MSRNFMNIFDYKWLTFLLFFQTLQSLDWQLNSVTTFSMKIERTFSSLFRLHVSYYYMMANDGGPWQPPPKATADFDAILCDRRIGARALSFTLPAFYSTNPPREEVACGATFTRITSECTCWLELENNSSAMATVTQNTESQIKLKLNFSS